MSDNKIAALLRSDASIVLIEAPAGCGKTFQAASYAADISSLIKRGKILVLTHTHAACSVIAAATNQVRSHVEIQTLDSFINQIAKAYRIPLNLPEDVSMWARENGYEELADKVALFMRSNPMICRHLALHYPVIICDEHQDSNRAQDELVQLINSQGALLRIFGDPMQIIPAGATQDEVVSETESRWEALKSISEFGELNTPHRWEKTNPALGEWVLTARKNIKEGLAIDLSINLPEGLTVVYAENGAEGNAPYRLVPEDWKDINGVVFEKSQMLILAGQKRTIEGIRSGLGRKFPIWEGHTRSSLETFLSSITDSDKESKVASFVKFLQGVMVGFNDSKYANILTREINNPTKKPRGNIPPHLKMMGQFINAEPNHKGFSKAAMYLKDLIKNDTQGFSELKIDYPRELDDFIKIGDFDEPISGYAEISQRRSRAHPKPQFKSLSTIHKSKGLEADSVVIIACDEAHFPKRKSKGNLLYVALSRATKKVSLVVSKKNPTTYLQLNSV